MKKVVYISYDGMTDALGQSQVLPYIFGLNKHGFEFIIISFEKTAKFERLNETIREVCNNNNVKWLPQVYTKKPPVLSTILDLIRLNRKLKEIFKGNEIAFIHCRSYLPSLLALKYRKEKGVPFIFDMRGFWADERVEGGIWNVKNPLFKWIYSYFKRKEKEMLLMSDCIISLTEKGKIEIENFRLKQFESNKIKVIPCCADFSHFTLQTEDNKRAAKRSLGLEEEDFVLGYVGSVGTWYLLDEMLEFYKCLKSSEPRSKFVFFTSDSKILEEKIQNIEELNASDFIIQFAEREELSFLMNSFDYSVFFIKPSFSKKASSPTKMAELLAKGIPLVVNSGVGDVDEVLAYVNGGIRINELNKKNYKIAVERLQNKNANEQSLIRKEAEQLLSLKSGISKYLKAYQSINKNDVM